MAQFTISENMKREGCDLSAAEASAFAIMYRAFATVIVQDEANEIRMRDAITNCLTQANVQDIDDETIARVNVLAHQGFTALNTWLDEIPHE